MAVYRQDKGCLHCPSRCTSHRYSASQKRSTYAAQKDFKGLGRMRHGPHVSLMGTSRESSRRQPLGHQRWKCAGGQRAACDIAEGERNAASTHVMHGHVRREATRSQPAPDVRQREGTLRTDRASHTWWRSACSACVALTKGKGGMHTAVI